MQGYRIAIADDHVMFRQGLRKILDEIDGIEVTGEVGDGLELMELLSEGPPDLVILDISMPKLHGLEAIGRIGREFPGVGILVLTMHREYLHEALRAGATGYLVKEDTDRELFTALERIRQGESYVSPRLREDDTHRAPLGCGNLSHREREILQLIVGGKSNREVAELLFLSVRTVEAHRAAILHKLDLRNTAELVRYAVEKRCVC